LASWLDGIGGAGKEVDSVLKHGVSPPSIACQRSQPPGMVQYHDATTVRVGAVTYEGQQAPGTH
jgi:hypothetical protein